MGALKDTSDKISSDIRKASDADLVAFDKFYRRELASPHQIQAMRSLAGKLRVIKKTVEADDLDDFASKLHGAYGFRPESALSQAELFSISANAFLRLKRYEALLPPMELSEAEKKAKEIKDWVDKEPIQSGGARSTKCRGESPILILRTRPSHTSTTDVLPVRRSWIFFGWKESLLLTLLLTGRMRGS